MGTFEIIILGLVYTNSNKPMPCSVDEKGCNPKTKRIKLMPNNY